MEAIIPLGDGGRDEVLIELYIADDGVAATTHNMEHGMRGASAFMVSFFALSAFAGEVAVTFYDGAIVRVERFPGDARPDAGILPRCHHPAG